MAVVVPVDPPIGDPVGDAPSHPAASTVVRDDASEPSPPWADVKGLTRPGGSRSVPAG
jgi:hypothetical protein